MTLQGGPPLPQYLVTWQVADRTIQSTPFLQSDSPSGHRIPAPTNSDAKEAPSSLQPLRHSWQYLHTEPLSRRNFTIKHTQVRALRSLLFDRHGCRHGERRICRDSLSSHVTDFRYWDTPPLFYGVFVGFRLAFRKAQPLALEPLLHLAHERLAAEGPAGVGALAQRQKLRGVFFAAM